jgi:hypothetical protein
MNLDQFMPKGGKINPSAFQNMMEQNVKMSKMKERMRRKAETKDETKGETNKTNMSYRENYDSNKSKIPSSSDNIKLDDLTSNLSSLMEEMKNNTSFIDDIIKKQGQRDANTNSMPGDDNSKRKSNNKRKVNKKNK